MEADSIQDAIDELADKLGSNIIVDDADMGDYPKEDRRYSGWERCSISIILMIHGQEGSECPFPCLYHGEGLPRMG